MAALAIVLHSCSQRLAFSLMFISMCPLAMCIFKKSVFMSMGSKITVQALYMSFLFPSGQSHSGC